jgi:hypothetical protein
MCSDPCRSLFPHFTLRVDPVHLHHLLLPHIHGGLGLPMPRFHSNGVSLLRSVLTHPLNVSLPRERGAFLEGASNVPI